MRRFIVVIASLVAFSFVGNAHAQYAKSQRSNFQLQKGLFLSNADVALSTDTLINVSGKNLVTVTATGNITGVRPVGGALGQVVVIKTGAGANTLRIDDGSYTNVGSNLTLTEGQGDVVTLLCTDATNQYWMKLSNSDN